MGQVLTCGEFFVSNTALHLKFNEPFPTLKGSDSSRINTFQFFVFIKTFSCGNLICVLE